MTFKKVTLAPLDPWRERPWIGGRDSYLTEWGHYVPTQSWSWTRRLFDYEPQMHPPLVTLGAYARKDYGRGRRRYSWSVGLNWGAIRLRLDPWSFEVSEEGGSRSATSLRQIFQAMKDFDDDAAREILWREAWRPEKCLEVHREEGPFCTLPALFNGFNRYLPLGKYVIIGPDKRPRIEEVSMWSVCTHVGREAPFETQGWLY
jgi:hypothetical protein